jgi:hypothetical protein
MIRALVIGLCILLLAVRASAECGWVLWGPIMDDRGQMLADQWSIVGAFESRQECVKAYDAYVASVSKPTPALREMLCVPDTVDPRGPKGR